MNDRSWALKATAYAEYPILDSTNLTHLIVRSRPIADIPDADRLASMDVFLRELAEALIERIEDRLGRTVAWIGVLIILLLTAGAVMFGTRVLA